MGKLHKRFNWKSRQIVQTVIDEREQNKIKIELNDEASATHYDAANALVLPSQKRKTKKLKNKNDAPVKLLSNKQRKKLQKITERKLKKSKREDLLNALNEVQAKTKHMSALTSLQSIQTLGRKKYLTPDFDKIRDVTVEDTRGVVTEDSKWKTPKTLKRELKDIQKPKKKQAKDIHVVQSESSSSSEDNVDSENECEIKEEELNEDMSTEVVEIDAADLNKNNDSSEEFQEIKNDIQPVNEGETSILQSEKLPPTSEPNLKAGVTHEIVMSEENQSFKRKFKYVNRDPEVQKQRLKLPILSEEHTVMEAVNEHPVTIVVGQTGSGKTTQVPQFLYEAGYTSGGKMIGVTEPRRVAAIQMSERVAFEMNLPSSQISYQIRFEGNTTDDTEIKFMTDGVLFKEIQRNHFLDNYSAIVIDEAHERSVHSDLLIGLLSRIVPKRIKRGDPLKLIIMSATLRIEDFTQNKDLFKDAVPPVIKINPRMFDVSIYFNKETDSDYLSSAYRKICKIHRQLPEGGILVFLTGQQEITELCRHLKATFPFRKSEKDGRKISNFKQRLKDKKENRSQKKNTVKIPDVNLNDFLDSSKNQKQFSEEVSSTIDENDDEFDRSFLAEKEQPLWVLPLYSMLPRHKQKMVFEPPPNGTRLCVVATNVAETSLTIPNIKYVVDSGKIKEKIYDPVTGISSFRITWTSKASANQRSGRAGRTSDGFCYRLYSSAVYNDELPQHSIPDIQRRPLDDVILSMKGLKIPVAKFPFPTPPNTEDVHRSIRRLIVLGALKEKKYLVNSQEGESLKDCCEITKLGKAMSNLPVAPRFAKMILCSLEFEGILPYMVLIIAVLTVQEILVEVPIGKKNLTDIQKRWEAHRVKWSSNGTSHLLGDLLVLINLILDAEGSNASYEWCQERGVRHSALLEVRKLRRQLTNEINIMLPEVNLTLCPNMSSPSHQQACTIAKVVLMGSLDQVARKVDLQELQTLSDKDAWKHGYRTVYSEKPAFLSLSSCLRKDQPRYVMYQDIFESSKIYLRGITVIDESWLLQFGESLVDLSPPLDVPKPFFDSKEGVVNCWRSGTFGPGKWPLKESKMRFPITKDLFKWLAFFLLSGELWPSLAKYTNDLIDPKIILSPVSLRYRKQKDDLIGALKSKSVTSSKSLEDVWKNHPNFLKDEYFAWFEDKSKLEELSSMWPPLKEDSNWVI